MRAWATGLVLSVVLSAGTASAYNAYDSRKLFSAPIFTSPISSEAGQGAYDPRNCNGVEWDDNDTLALARVTAGPRVNFVRSPQDREAAADNCPAAGEACRKKSYLVTGDLVLTGRTRGDFTCVSYQSTAKGAVRTQVWTHGWTHGWLPRAALTGLAPTPSPDIADWLGTWNQPHGTIEIKAGGIGGRLQIDGLMMVPTARDFHNGTLDAQVLPSKDGIAFLNDGWLPFETKCDSGCRVRMRRVGPWLLVQDNGDCGGAGVSFTGLYRRKP
jgi:hypothetical protein